MTLSTPAHSAQICLDVTFSDAVVYAGSTDFVFNLDPDLGTRLILRSAHESENLVGSDALLGDAVDGPAEADPDRLGRLHRLCFEEGRVHIELAEG